ncbi:MAG: 2Fe-2S ferredoxin [Deltaproteobacteria bacterium]|nr:2Fe-2S ferredoxin [Deltaproteobacteria bacterium]
MNWTAHEQAPVPGTPLCRFDKVPEGEGREVTFGEEPFPFRMFVVRRESQVWGYVNSCPHNRIPLNFRPDKFVTYDKTHILCSVHFALFEYDDGFCIDGPCAGQSLESVPVELREGMICIAEE